MELHQLRYFVAAAEELSMTRAAKRSHVSQPALSRQIALLEEEIGVFLFDRIRQRIHLTDAGKAFLPRARQILCDVETSAQLLRENFGSKPRTLRIGYVGPFLEDLIMPAVKKLRARSKRAEFALFELTPRAQLDRLRNGELDLAILGNLDSKSRASLTTSEVMRSPYAIVLPDDHRLASRKQLDLGELAGEPYVSLADQLYPGRSELLHDL
ncbi:MAG: LysR family transcriptional regulator, partial [Verrucomicrobiota bacterium]